MLQVLKQYPKLARKFSCLFLVACSIFFFFQIQNPNPPTRVGVTSILILCRVQNVYQNPKYQNPKSKIQNHRGPHKKNCYITVQNPKSPNPGQKSLDFGRNFGFWIPDFEGVQGTYHPGPAVTTSFGILLFGQRRAKVM